MAESNTYDMPVMVGAGLVCLIAIGIFWYTRPEPVRPVPPAEPITTPLNAQAAPVVMVETSGTGKPGEGGPAIGGAVGGGMTSAPTAVGKSSGGGGPAPVGGAGPGRAN